MFKGINIESKLAGSWGEKKLGRDAFEGAYTFVSQFERGSILIIEDGGELIACRKIKKEKYQDIPKNQLWILSKIRKKMRQFKFGIT